MTSKPASAVRCQPLAYFLFRSFRCQRHTESKSNGSEKCKRNGDNKNNKSRGEETGDIEEEDIVLSDGLMCVNAKWCFSH